MKFASQVDCWTDISTASAVLPAGTLYISVQNRGNIPNQLQIGALSCCVNNGTANLCGLSQNGIVVSGLQNTTLAAGANTTFIFNVGEPTHRQKHHVCQYCAAGTGLFRCWVSSPCLGRTTAVTCRVTHVIGGTPRLPAAVPLSYAWACTQMGQSTLCSNCTAEPCRVVQLVDAVHNGVDKHAEMCLMLHLNMCTVEGPLPPSGSATATEPWARHAMPVGAAAWRSSVGYECVLPSANVWWMTHQKAGASSVPAVALPCAWLQGCRGTRG